MSNIIPFEVLTACHLKPNNISWKPGGLSNTFMAQSVRAPALNRAERKWFEPLL